MKIVTDSAANLSLEEARSLEVEIAPLYIQFPDGELDSSTISADEFYSRLRDIAPRIPTTAQPSPDMFSRIYSKFGSSGEEVLSIHISSGLSGTLGSARLGAAQQPKQHICLVDSMTLSGGERFQVLAAANSARAGRSQEFILSRLEEIRAATEVIFTLETLEYLQRGGRIGRVQALAGALLHIKPLIHVDRTDGKYSTVGRERTISKAMETIVNYIAQQYGDQIPIQVSVMHGQMPEQANQLASLVQERVSVKKLETLRISPVLGVHTGPGVVGLAVIPMQLMEGL